jgi:hypothetical protein
VEISGQELVNLNQYYLDDAHRIIQERFWEQETVTWVANCGYWERFGYVLLSSERLFTILFENRSAGILGAGRKRIVYDRRSSFLDMVMGSDGLDRGLYLPPNSKLTQKELTSRIVREALLSQITKVDRQDYEVKVDGNTETMVYISVTSLGKNQVGEPIFYTHQDGQFLYTFLRDLSRKYVPEVDPTSNSEAISLIRALAKLHQAGILTDEEFETKKQELLSRI